MRITALYIYDEEIPNQQEPAWRYAVGDVVSGRVIEERKVRSRLAEVYVARNINLNRREIVKCPCGELLLGADRAEVKTRFVGEARAQAALNHADICVIHDLDEQAGAIFIELVSGDSLKAAREQRAFAEREVLEIGIRIADAMTYAHEADSAISKPPVAHFDLKPSNVMLTAGGGIKVLDFGLARILNRGGLDDSLRGGTPGFIAPERLRGEEGDERSDVFSLGATLYWLVTRQYAYLPGNGFVGNPQPFDVFDFEPWPELFNVLLGALQPSPEDRTPTMRAVADQLRARAEEFTPRPNDYAFFDSSTLTQILVPARGKKRTRAEQQLDVHRRRRRAITSASALLETLEATVRTYFECKNHLAKTPDIVALVQDAKRDLRRRNSATLEWLALSDEEKSLFFQKTAGCYLERFQKMVRQLAPAILDPSEYARRKDEFGRVQAIPWGDAGRLAEARACGAEWIFADEPRFGSYKKVLSVVGPNCFRFRLPAQEGRKGQSNPTQNGNIPASEKTTVTL